MKKQNSKRFIIMAMVVAILMVGFQLWKNFSQDPDLGDFNSVDHIVAIERDGARGRVVMFDGSGKRIEAPKPSKSEWDDREISWSVDGQRVFLSSNRDSNAYSVYRWNPAKNRIERRSIGSTSQGTPWFGPHSDPEAKKYGLIQAGGQILALEVATGATGTVLPPTAERVSTGEEQGTGTSMDLYKNFGHSFVKARFAGARDRIVGLMRSDEGSTVIFQPIGVDEQGNPLRPLEIYRGDRADIDVDRSGTIGVMLSGFQFPPNAEIPADFIKDGKAVPPFGSGIFKVTLGPDMNPKIDPVGLVPNEAMETFVDFALSPDGSKVAVVVGEKQAAGGFKPVFLVVMPFEANGSQRLAQIVYGAVASPSWSADGTKITYLKTTGEGENSNTDVYRIGADGSGELKLTNGGNWASPLFSPATGS